ncbi:hypothetical protein ACQP1K_07785 [Sphaerimonospora sp. CA-214678]
MLIVVPLLGRFTALEVPMDGTGQDGAHAARSSPPPTTSGLR